MISNPNRPARGLGLVLCSALAMLAGCNDPERVASDSRGHSIVDEPPQQGQQGPLAFDGGMGDRIFFKFDSSAITPEARATLERIAAWAKAHQDASLIVEGHCDDRGTREYNLALGERRAEAARDAEVALGVEAGRLQTISYGKERPAATGETEAAWAQNRRAVFVVK